MNIALLLNKQPTRLPRLCGDITNIIVDFLSQERDTLLACSLVGRDWVHRSQTHLLQDITLTSQERLSLFLSTLPTMTERVRRMVHILQVGFYEPSYGPMQISRAQVISILDHFPRLDRLRLHDLQLCGLEEPLGDRYVPRALDMLSFKDVRGASLTRACPLEIIAFVCLFHSLRILDVDTTESFSYMEYPTTSIEDVYTTILQSSSTMPICLHVEQFLTGQSPLTAPLLQFLRIAGAVRTLHTVFLACYRMAALIAFYELFADDPSKLEMLFFDFTPIARFLKDDNVEVLDWEIKPSSFSRLQTVYTRMNFDAVSLQSSVLMWHRMLGILDHLSKTQAKSLEIAIRAAPTLPIDPFEPVARTLRGLNWTRLDQILRQFQHLFGDPCVRIYAREEEIQAVSRYLEIIFYRLPLCKTERRVQLEWLCLTSKALTVRQYADMMGPISGMLIPSRA